MTNIAKHFILTKVRFLYQCSDHLSHSKNFTFLFPLIFLSKHISLYALGRIRWILDTYYLTFKSTKAKKPKKKSGSGSSDDGSSSSKKLNQINRRLSCESGGDDASPRQPKVQFSDMEEELKPRCVYHEWFCSYFLVFNSYKKSLKNQLIKK